MSGRPVQFVAPLPPLKTGIAQYTEDILRTVDGAWLVRVFAEPGSADIEGATISSVTERRSPDPSLPTVIQIGNSGNHPRAFDLAAKLDGVLVLHDVVLHHARLAHFITSGKTRQYLDEIGGLYGPEGVQLAQEILRGRSAQNLLDFPMFEPFVERARLTIVHNEFARRAVLDRVPTAQVARVPMGIPLPALVNQAEARTALGLPQSAFIVASITHINPMKRLPVVLRAFRRVAAVVPDALMIIAGTPSPEVNLDQQIQVLGLEGRAQLWGYVPDSQARLLARASDVCVNLRFPGTGETSASLLRLLGAERPVLVTDGVASSELPPDVGLRVPVDRFEEEMITELLAELADNPSLRKAAGRVARQFVEQEHSMGQAIEGYRSALKAAYGIELPQPANGLVVETAPTGPRHVQNERPHQHSELDSVVGGALAELGIDHHPPTVEQVAAAMVDLGLNQFRATAVAPATSRRVDERLLARLACPSCGGRVARTGDCLACEACGTPVDQQSGIVDLVEPDLS